MNRGFWRPLRSEPFDACYPTGTGKSAGREIKEWQAIMDHFRKLPVKSKGDLSVIPVDECAAEVRAIKAD